MTSGVDEDAFVEEAVRLGLLGKSLAVRARASWEQAGVGIPFDEFLVEQGLIAPEQRLAILDGHDQTQVSGAPAADPADQEPQPGERHSDCTIVEKLGEGGMGAVFLAKDPTGRPVVLKFLAPALARHESLRARFAREGAILFRLAPHPNLVRVLGIAADAAKPHIIMELLEGQALDQTLKQQFNLPPLDAVRIARDAARGLAAIHAAGIIHRDIKPANLFITVDGVVKLIDFGLAKDLRATDGLSRPGMRLGTPHYMAPEQWGNHVVDHRCDLFALGGTLYNMVVGEPPFLGRDTAAVAQKVLTGEYTSPEQIIQRLPEDLPLVIAQLLQPDPNHRYADATRVAADLQRLLDRQPVLVPRLLEQRGGGVTKRHPLVPGSLFVVGRNDACLVQLRHPSVSAEHARVRREQHGFVIQDAGSTFGTFVGESPVVRETKLRDGDKIRLGKVVLEFKDEGVAAGPARSPKGSAGHPPIAHEAAEPTLEALAEAGDKRVALWLIDLVAPLKKDEAERAALAALVGEEAVGPALEKAAARRGEQRAWAAARLRDMSGLDHGPDVAQWLLWWDTVRRDLPPQAAPREARRGWGVAVGEGLPGNPTLWLPADPAATIGRGEECALRLTHQSVSRVHATLYRFPRRIVLRDEGSRFGTLLNGERVSIAFLAPGDRIEVGGAVLTVAVRDQGPVRMTLGTIGLDPRLVEALEALDHPSVTLCTARALHQAARLADLEQELRPLFPQGAPAAVIERVARTYRTRAEKAKSLLARLLGLPADQANAWRNALAEKRAGLPPQVMPLAWFPEKEEPPPSK